MEFQYTIERLNAKQRYMRVRYDQPGKTPVRLSFSPTSFDEPYLLQMILEKFPDVLAEWNTQAAQPTIDEGTAPFPLTGELAYVPVEDSPEVLQKRALDNNTAARYVKEFEGLNWIESSSGKMFVIDTTSAGQGLLNIERMAADNGTRPDNALWRCKEVVVDEYVIRYRATSHAEILAWGALVDAHIRKCVQAEANTAAKILAGELTANFFTEFSALS